MQIWYLRNSISHKALNELLEVLRCYGHQDLPKDCRTILNTPTVIQTVQMGDGLYWHNGVRNSLLHILKRLSNVPSEVSLIVNADGIKLSKSSKYEMWPILYRIHELPNIPPTVVGIYAGDKKPKTCEDFLRKFVNEMKDLMQDGLEVNQQIVFVKLRCVICDSPARAFVKGINYLEIVDDKKFNYMHLFFFFRNCLLQPLFRVL